jgi:hypothetical protein
MQRPRPDRLDDDRGDLVRRDELVEEDLVNQARSAAANGAW